MNLLAWLDTLSGVASSSDTDTGTNAADLASRRTALARLGRAAAATLPALTLAGNAVAGPPRVTSLTTDALNLTLRVALAQKALLTLALDTASTSVPAAERPTVETLLTLTTDMVARLGLSVGQSGDPVATPANYDFTGGRSAAGTGPLQPATSPDDFLGLTQELADLLTRTFISTMPALAGNTVFSELTAQFLGTASRIAATVRLMRQRRGATTANAWITEEDLAGAPTLFGGVYEGEASTTVFKLDLLQNIPAAPGNLLITVLPLPLPPRATITEAFDQPLPLDAGSTTVTAEVLPLKKVDALLTLLTY